MKLTRLLWLFIVVILTSACGRPQVVTLRITERIRERERVTGEQGDTTPKERLAAVIQEVQKENPTSQVVQALVTTAEKVEAPRISATELLVSSFYRGLLQREADPAGLTYYTKYLENGGSMTHVIESFALSQEFSNLHPTEQDFGAALSRFFQQGALGIDVTQWVTQIIATRFPRIAAIQNGGAQIPPAQVVQQQLQAQAEAVAASHPILNLIHRLRNR